MCGRKGELKPQPSAKTHAFQVGAEKNKNWISLHLHIIYD